MTDPRKLDAVRDALDELAERDAVARLHARDTTLFSDDARVQAAVAERLGWLDAATEPAGAAARLSAFAEAVRSDGIDRVVLAGMGGSSLAPEVFATVFADRGLPVEVLDSTHPGAVEAVFDPARLSSALVIVASKSGVTEETRAFGALAASLLPPDRLVAITDPGTELDERARSAGWREVFTNPADIGGRFAALSYFGMAPAALTGVPLAEVWRSAAAMAERCSSRAGLDENPAAVLGAFMAGLARAGQDKLTVLLPPPIAALGDWIEQLVAESTGKDGRGVVPVVGEPTAAPPAYGADRAFVEVRLGGRPVPGAAELAADGRPVISLDLPGPADLGGAFLQWELATAYAGLLLGVNPFDEPNVAESKDRTRAMLAEAADGRELPEPEQGDLAGLLATVRRGDYVSLQAYLPPTDAARAVLHEARMRVRDGLGVATTVGFGPRFLHSTGQLHKGGPDSVVAVQIVDPARGGPAIPGRPYDFAALIRAQALGDLRSLQAHGRRVTRVTLEADRVPDLATWVAEALPSPARTPRRADPPQVG